LASTASSEAKPSPLKPSQKLWSDPQRQYEALSPALAAVEGERCCGGIVPA